MIEWIHLKNFQNHSDTRLDFSSGLNVIAGGSDQGKSAVLRALNWVRFNRPTGTEYIRKAKKKLTCSVTIKCTDAKAVTRVRSATENYYMIGTEKFKAIGTNVPEEVATQLNFSEVNIQNQFSEYFLMQDSPGDVAKFMNRITNLDVIDMVFLEAKRRTMKMKIVIEDTERNLNFNKEAVKEFDYIEEAEALINAVEKEWDEHGRLVGRKKKLGTILSDIQHVAHKIKDASFTISLHKECSGIRGVAEEIAEDVFYKKKLGGAIKDLSEKQEDLSLVNSWLKIIADKKPVEQACEEHTRLVVRQRALSKIIKRLDSCEEKRVASIQREKTLTKRYDTLKLQIKVCPICNRAMNKVNVAHKNCN